jgi:hypothetical protein
MAVALPSKFTMTQRRFHYQENTRPRVLRILHLQNT